jgi:hypothetical protein
MTAQYLFRLDPLTTITLAADTTFGAHVTVQQWVQRQPCTLANPDGYELISRKHWPSSPGPNQLPESERQRRANRRWKARQRKAARGVEIFEQALAQGLRGKELEEAVLAAVEFTSE